MASAMLKSLSRSHSRGSVVQWLRTLTSRLRLWIIQPHHKHKRVFRVLSDGIMPSQSSGASFALAWSPSLPLHPLLFHCLWENSRESLHQMNLCLFMKSIRCLKNISLALHYLLGWVKNFFFISGDDLVVRRVLKNESPHFKPTDLLASDQHRFFTHHQKLTRMYFEFNSSQVLQLYKHPDS